MPYRDRIVLKVLLSVIIILLVISSVQYISYEHARNKVLSLPCRRELAPYSLYLESLLPPDEILSKGIGHRYSPNGKLEVVVGEKLGSRSREYEYQLQDISRLFNYSVETLREELRNGTNVESAFGWVVTYYTALKLAEDYGNTNLTAVVFSPMPPLKWVLSIKKTGERVVSLPEFWALIFGFAVMFGLFFALYVGSLVANRLGRKSKFGSTLAIVISLLFFVSVVGVFTYTASIFPSSFAQDKPSPKDCVGEYWKFENDIISQAYHKSSTETMSCEVVNYLNKELSREEMEKLLSSLSLNCTAFSN